MNHRIVDVQLYTAESTMSRPIADSTHDISTIKFHIVEVTSASGITGQGYLLSFHFQTKRVGKDHGMVHSPERVQGT